MGGLLYTARWAVSSHFRHQGDYSVPGPKASTNSHGGTASQIPPPGHSMCSEVVCAASHGPQARCSRGHWPASLGPILSASKQSLARLLSKKGLGSPASLLPWRICPAPCLPAQNQLSQLTFWAQSAHPHTTGRSSLMLAIPCVKSEAGPREILDGNASSFGPH